MENPEPKEPNTEHPWTPAAVWRREWPVVKNSPIASILCLLLGGILIWALYNIFIIPGKDATIENLQTKSENGATPMTNTVYSTTTNTVYIPVTNVVQQSQWYLKIKKIEYIPTSDVAPAIVTQFRLLASVNGQPFSFPVEGMFFGKVSTNGIETDDSSPLPISEKYEVRFDRATFRNSLHSIGTDTLERTNVITSGFGKPDQFESKNLPSGGTNGIAVSIYGQEAAVGVLRITYEISQ